MKRLELFKALCEVTDALEEVTDGLPRTTPRTALEALTGRLDGLIDRCIREGVQPLHAADLSPCPACGQTRCTHWRVLQGTAPVGADEG